MKTKIRKDFEKKRNMLRNNVKQSIVKGRSLKQGEGIIPKSKKYAK